MHGADSLNRKYDCRGAMAGTGTGQEMLNITEVDVLRIQIANGCQGYR